MSEQLPITRRDALMAATVLGAVAGVSGAAEKRPIDESNDSLKLKIMMTDGQVVEFKAKRAVITFGGAGSLIATPSGILPVSMGHAEEEPLIPLERPTPDTRRSRPDFPKASKDEFRPQDPVDGKAVPNPQY